MESNKSRPWPLTWLCVGALLLGTGVATAEDDAGALDVRLEPGASAAVTEPRFGAAAVETELVAAAQPPSAGHDHLEGELALGLPDSPPRRVLLWRSKADVPYDMLRLDANGNGDLTDDRPMRAELRTGGGTTWSTFTVPARVNHGTAAKPAWQTHPMGFWVLVKEEGEKPETLYATAHGYRTGRTQIGDDSYAVVLSDANSDGVYAAGDYWTVRPAKTKTPYEFFEARKVGDFAWAGGRAWKLELDGTAGMAARLVPFEPGISQEADDRKRDPCYDDRRAKKAEMALNLQIDFDGGLAKARQEIAPYLLYFAGVQDMTSQNLERLVFVQQGVVDAAAGLVAIRIEADEREDLMKRFKVKGRPVGVLFDPAGTEVARFEGYRTGEQMRAFVGEVNPWLAPSDDEPTLKGKAKKRNAKEVKRIYDYMQGKKQPGLLVDRIKDVGSQGTRAARDALMQFAIKRKSKEYIAAAFHGLATIGGSRAIGFVCGKHALASGDFLVAQSAANALANARSALAIEPILAVMTNKRTKVEIVHACALALAQSGPEDLRVIEAVFEYSGHKKDTARAGAVEALGYLASDRAIAKLKQVLTTEKNARVRAAAATGLGHTKRPEVIPFLRSAIEKENSHHVKTAGLDSIQKLQNPGADK